ncbi:hypothetical protein [Labilibaculum antarcticum]|uniref:Uncharacterized protein n=1 Tax=Labilibaculum antarcticum TaxID=1717717 RepID=A0A1Y1CQA8_9BACT|nr:hypothetical protein [Labilibaculum antarcticum]BAX82618.1 hypothetical protein ALGA_4328 [Labilibaculum antarcticum]
MDQFVWWIIENKTHLEIIDILNAQKESRPWVNYFTSESLMSPGNLNSACRIGYVPFSNCKQNCFYYLDQSRYIETIAAGGICTEIYWDSTPENLPEGWQGSVRRAYLESKIDEKKPNTIVALLAFTLSRYRKKGFSGKVISKMCIYGKENGYDYCIIPTLPPTQFEKPFINMTVDEIAKLKRDDGHYYDYWLRLHTQKGAQIIGTDKKSHRFVFSIKDFSKHVSSCPVNTSGEHLVTLDKALSLGRNGKNMWQKVYVNIEQDIVQFDWGCIWVQYDLKKLNFNL